jgi:hypothetical protein
MKKTSAQAAKLLYGDEPPGKNRPYCMDVESISHLKSIVRSV